MTCGIGIFLVKSRVYTVIAYQNYGGAVSALWDTFYQSLFRRNLLDPSCFTMWCHRQLGREQFIPSTHQEGEALMNCGFSPYIYSFRYLAHSASHDPNSKWVEAQIKTRDYLEEPRSTSFPNSDLILCPCFN